MHKELEERILAVYTRSFVLLGTQLQHAVECERMNPQMLCMLELLRERGALPVGELSECAHMNRGNCSTACKRLENEGLVRRRRKPEDERVVLIELTEEGENLLFRIQRRTCSEVLKRVKQLSDEQLKKLLESVEILETIFESESKEKGK